MTFTIYNLIGQKIISGDNNEAGIDVSKIPSGIYVVEVNDGQKTISKKFVKE
uniref:T9SS type A sorting domain-containing protein n=1 Tax=Flavobacterium sp. TaxID=239 RepID=UPI0040473BE4